MSAAESLSLHRPLVSFDLETTGLDVQNDRVVEICCVTLKPDGSRSTWVKRINPQQPIHPAATAVHGITDADVADAPVFAAIADELMAVCAGADLTGFNIERFDLPMLRCEFGRLGKTFPHAHTSILDSCRIFFRKEPRDLSAALRTYCGRELVGAHGAEADATAALDVLLGQVARYDDLPRDVYNLHIYCHPQKPEWLDGEGKVVWSSGEATLSFGKHRNKSLRTLSQEQPDYLRWLVQDSNFSSEVKSLCAQALQGEYPTPSAEVRQAIAAASGTPSKAAAAPAVAAVAPARPVGRHGQTSLF